MLDVSELSTSLDGLLSQSREFGATSVEVQHSSDLAPAAEWQFEFLAPERLDVKFHVRAIGRQALEPGLSICRLGGRHCTEFLPPIQTGADILAKMPAFERQIRTRFAC